MIVAQRVYISIFLIIYLHIFSSRFAFSQHWWKLNSSLVNSTAGISTSWINRPFFIANSTADFYALTPILLSGTEGPRYHVCGFYCDYSATECVLGILLVIFQHSSTSEINYIYEPQLVWSANRNHPVKANPTLQLSQDGNLVLADSDGTLVWSTNTTGKSNLVSGQKLIASVSASNWSQGLLSFTILNGSLVAYADTSPPQYYYASQYYMNGTNSSFDGQTLSLAYFGQFMKLEHNGHLRIYRFDRDELDWKVEYDVGAYELGNCGYPMVCGRYSICTSDGQCNCPYEGNFFRPSIGRKANLGCTELTSISCDSLQYHSLLE
ncbi:hypothetical protein HAX54_008111, partial [Datura stramonium]|nr:hypothetical protein [Datura stramonium]